MRLPNPRILLPLFCVLLTCDLPPAAPDKSERGRGWVQVGRGSEHPVGVAPPTLPAPQRERAHEKMEHAATARVEAVAAWRATRDEKGALGLARAYFPEFAGDSGSETAQAPVNVEAALRVKLAEVEGGEMELATRGHIFRAREVGPMVAQALGKRESEAAAFYGARHFWTKVGGTRIVGAGEWLAQRVEEYVVLEEGGQPYHARYEVKVPESVMAVKDAGEYIEFLDRVGTPVLRLHYPVARDSAGLSRQGVVRLCGALPDARHGAGYALRGGKVEFEATVVTEGMRGPVVIDPGWSSTGSMAAARVFHTATLLPSGNVLVVSGPSEVYDPETGTWSSTGSIQQQSRIFHTATLLPSGRVLVIGGIDDTGYLATASLYDPATGTWAPTGSMANARHMHTATLLASGKVLVAGGRNSNGPLATAELYDPATGLWTSTGPMPVAHGNHTATLLRSGKVLVTGGHTGSTFLSTAAVYNPATGTWAPTVPMAEVRYNHTATLLPSGKVLVVGGSFTTEVYDPETESWTLTGQLNSQRGGRTATLLPSGKVLVTGGGYNLVTFSSAEVYDPATGVWAVTASLATPREYHSSTLLSSGKVLVAGGRIFDLGAVTATAEVYDSGTGAWTYTDSMATPRHSHTATLLPTGKVLAVGGSGLATAEVFHPTTGSWISTGLMATLRYSHTAILLPSGKVLVVGGSTGSVVNSNAETYSSETATWSFTGPMVFPHQNHTATLLPSGKVLVADGATEIYDPEANLWTQTGAMISGRTSHTATLLPSGKVLVAGGVSTSPVATAEVYDTSTNSWMPTGPMSIARVMHTATLLPSGKVLVAGGSSGGINVTETAELYDPATGFWTPTGSMTSPRFAHAATLLPSGNVLVTGGTNDNFVSTTTAEVYDPATGSWGSTNSMATPRSYHTATLLVSGKVLVAGGFGTSGSVATVELYENTGAFGWWQPVVYPLDTQRPGATFDVSGVGFRGLSEGSGSNFQNSATDFPLVSLMAVEGERLAMLPGRNFSKDSVTVNMPNVPDGYYRLTVSVNAIPGGQMILVDGTPPNTPAISSPPDGMLFNISMPVFVGTAEAHSSVTVLLDGIAIWLGPANVPGIWTFRPTIALADGAHTVTASATDAAGNTSLTSAARFFTIDTVVPAAPSITAPAAWAAVNSGRPLFSGSVEANTTLRVYFDGSTTPAGTVTASATGAWSFTPTATLPDGAHSVTATATDAAGNTGLPAATVSFIVDTVAPAAPSVTMPAARAVLNSNRPVVCGTAEANTTVRVYFDGSTTPAGTVTASASGAWCFTPTATLPDGPHSVTATSTDAAGNTSPASANQSFTVDTVAPPAPSITAPAGGAFVNTGTPTISGTAEPNSTVSVYLDGQLWTSVVTEGDGAWSWTTSEELALEDHVIMATATDTAGNVGPASAPTNFIVATRGVYGWGCSCTSATDHAWPWLGLAFGAWLLKLRPRRSKRHPPAWTNNPALRSVALTRHAAWLLVFMSVEAMAAAPALPTTGLQPAALEGKRLAERTLNLEVGVRAELEVLKYGLTAAVSAELSGDTLGATLTFILQPYPGLRAEGRVYPFRLGASRPYLALGSTVFFPAVSARAAAGCDINLGFMHLLADAAFEHYFNPRRGYVADALLFSVGAGRTF